jgi:hypothetical protein
VAGEKLFVDWVGDGVPVFGPITGAAHNTRIFVVAHGATALGTDGEIGGGGRAIVFGAIVGRPANPASRSQSSR